MQFVPANKLSSHREKADAPWLRKARVMANFPPARKIGHVLITIFCVRFFLRVRNEERGNYFKGWSWTIEIRFFSLAASLPPLLAENEIYATLSIWELKKINWNCAGPNKNRGVMSRVLHSSGLQTTKRACVCVCMKTPTKTVEGRNKDTNKIAIYIYIIFLSLQSICVMEFITSIFGTLAILSWLFFIHLHIPLPQTLIIQPRQTSLL